MPSSPPPAPPSPSSPTTAFRGLVAAFGVSSIGFGTIAPFLVLWGHRTAGLSGSLAGLLFVAQAAGELSGGLAGGLIADRLGARQVLLASTTGMALGYGALAAVTTPVPAVLVLFAAGLFEAAYHPTAFALVGDLTPADRRPHAFGVIRAAGNLGTILGPLAGAAIVAGAPVRVVFLLCGGLLAVSGLVVLVTLPRSGSRVDLAEEADEVRAAVPGVQAIARDRRLALLVAGGALLTITLAWWESDGLAILQTQRPFGAGTFSLMLALAAGLTVIFQIPITRLTRGRPVPALIAGGALLQAIGLATLAGASAGLGVVIGAVVLIAVGDMVSGPNLQFLVASIAPRGREVTYQAAISTTMDVGMAAGPASGLALSAKLGARVLWGLALPLGLLAGATSARAARDAAPADTGPEPGRAGLSLE